MIYPYQREVYGQLQKTANAFDFCRHFNLPVKPRLHRLVLGSTGSGKSHIVSELGRKTGWRTLHLNTSSWTILGGREYPTWADICDFLAEGSSRKPALIILDEIDKVSGNDSWTRFLQCEVFDLLDGRIPPQVEARDIDRGECIDRLAHTLIIGIGAFQHAIDAKPSLGFGGEKEILDQSVIKQTLPPELVNRFDDQLLILPTPQRKDYAEMVEVLCDGTLSGVEPLIREMAVKRIEDAITNASGARFAENLLAAALVEWCKEPPPLNSVPEFLPKESDPFDISG